MSEATIERGVDVANIKALIHGNELGLPGYEGPAHSQIFGRYATSKFGVFQAEQVPRFSGRYGYDRDTMLEDLGDDVHPTLHMPYTEREILRPLFEWQNVHHAGSAESFSPFDITVGRVAASLHDIGECEHPDLAGLGTVGDVVFWEKTEDDEKAETRIRRHIYESIFTDIPKDILDRAEDTITNKEGGLLREGFATAEYVGYFISGITAGRAALKLQGNIDSEQDEHRFTQLRNMGVAVSDSWYPKISDLAEQFPYAGYIAQLHHKDFDEIQTKLA